MNLRVLWIMTAFLLVFGGEAAWAVNPDEILRDAKMEQRARTISKNLRCLVCQNQSIDDSDAELAADLRLLVRERLLVGDTNEQVLDFVVDRYGDFVLLQPPVNAQTYALWGAPFFFMLVGAGVFILSMRRRAAAATKPKRLSAAEQTRIDELLGKDG